MVFRATIASGETLGPALLVRAQEAHEAAALPQWQICVAVLVGVWVPVRASTALYFQQELEVIEQISSACQVPQQAAFPCKSNNWRQLST